MLHGIEYRRWEKVCSIWADIIIVIISTFITNIITTRVVYPMNIPRLQETPHKPRTVMNKTNQKTCIPQ